MDEKVKLIEEIKELWNTKDIPQFDIAPELLEYLTLRDLQKLKAKILQSQKVLSEEQKEWLLQFRKY